MYETLLNKKYRENKAEDEELREDCVKKQLDKERKDYNGWCR